MGTSRRGQSRPGTTPTGRPARDAARRGTSALVVAALLAVGLVAAPADADEVAARDRSAGCDRPVLDRPQPAASAVRGRPLLRERALASFASPIGADRSGALSDPDLWLDTCGVPFFADTGHEAQGSQTFPPPSSDPEGPGTSAIDPQWTATQTMPSGTDVLTLHSRPDATRTIFLDAGGATLSGTNWNTDYQHPDPIVLPPFSADATVSTSFSAADKEALYRAWSTVAADYAPFDVDVTTQRPDPAELARVDLSDTTYGSRVVLTTQHDAFPTNVSGLASTGGFDTVGAEHDYRSTALVFADRVMKEGWYVGEAAAHEVGHLAGLNHDVDSSGGYEDGSAPWGPIMGAAYLRSLSQWSQGEFPGATNHEDDLALIAQHIAPLVEDEVGSTAQTAALLTGSSDGVITSAGDVDAFTLSATGPTTVEVTAPLPSTDLDVRLTIRNGSGSTVATVNPQAPTNPVPYPAQDWLGARWSGVLPADQGPFTAFVAGAGSGDPSSSAANYSAYGSLGAYRISVTPAAPLALTAPATVTVVRSRSADVGGFSATGGLGDPTFSASGLPAGLTMTGAGRITGTPTTLTDSAPVRVTVTDGVGATASQTIAVTVGLERRALSFTPVRLTAGRIVTMQLGTTGYRLGSAPGWASLSADGSALSAAPSKAGTFSVELQRETDSILWVGALAVTVDPKLTVTTTSLANARRGRAYSATVQSVGAKTGATWQVSGLPQGLRVVRKGANKSILTGKVGRVALKRYPVVVVVSSPDGQRSSRKLWLRVTR